MVQLVLQMLAFKNDISFFRGYGVLAEQLCCGEACGLLLLFGEAFATRACHALGCKWLMWLVGWLVG